MKSAVPKILWLMILTYIIIFGIFSAVRHYQFQTQAWDMGIFDQLFWNTTHGQFMQSSLEEIPNHFGIHFSPTLLLLVPGYLLFSSPYYLLLMQTVALALGAWPLYLLARKKLKDPLPLIIAGAYLLYPALHWINTFDFHEIAFFVPLALAGFYFIEEKLWLAASVFLLLAAGTKEDAILMVFFIGLYTLINGIFQKSKQQKIAGLAIALSALMLFLTVIKIIMPSFGGGLLRLDRYHELGTSASDIIVNSIANPFLPLSIIFQPEKMRYIIWLILPTALLPLLSWPSLILVLPGILENTLTNFKSQFSGLYQYDAVLIPGIFLGMILGIEFLLKKYPDNRVPLRKIMMIAGFVGFLLRSPLSPASFPKDLFTSNPDRNAINELLSKIPNNASVTAPTNLVPHLSQRKEIYILGTEPAAADIVIIDENNLSEFNDQNQLQNYADSYMNYGNYAYEEIQNRYFILKRKGL